jgi:hypothetical protein
MTLTADRPEVPAGGYSSLLPATLNRSAVSIEAEAVRSAANAIVDHGEESLALFGEKNAAISELIALVIESHDDAGEDMDPISPRAAGIAVDFIRTLPEDIPLPELAWEPDGELSLDWIPARHCTFTLSIGATPRLPYAWIDGSDKGHGVAVFDGDSIPGSILDGIRRIVRRGHAAVRTA